jgi:hypothetical protein
MTRSRRQFSTLDPGGLLFAAGLALAFATQALAQGASPAPPSMQAIPEKMEPGPVAPQNRVAPHDDLSRKLDRSDGVIKPPPTGDAEIHIKPKDENVGNMPVIPPPGSPGGRQDIQPK